jgi:hypothetical protein
MSIKLLIVDNNENILFSKRICDSELTEANMDEVSFVSKTEGEKQKIINSIKTKKLNTASAIINKYRNM